MTTALTLISGATVFFIGFILGNGFNFPKSKKSFNRYTDKNQKSGIIKEYHNFLNYDGSLQ